MSTIGTFTKSESGYAGTVRTLNVAEHPISGYARQAMGGVDGADPAGRFLAGAGSPATADVAGQSGWNISWTGLAPDLRRCCTLDPDRHRRRPGCARSRGRRQPHCIPARQSVQHTVNLVG